MNNFLIAKPTEYAGIRFRSKLEATWAAFFDELGWSWEYEPDGFEGYIPDFILRGDGRHVFVEVKPYDVYQADRRAIVEKAFNAIGVGADLLVLTDQLVESEGNGLAIGYMPGEEYGTDARGVDYTTPAHLTAVDEQAILCVRELGAFYDIRHTWGSWESRLSSQPYHGNADFWDVPVGEVYKIWSRARNKLQWMPARRIGEIAHPIVGGILRRGRA